MFKLSPNFSYYTLWLFFLMGMITLSGRLLASHALTIHGINLCMLKMAPGPERAACSGRESWLLSRLQEPELARKSLKRFLNTNPNHQIDRLRLGQIYWELGSQTAAVTTWQQVPKVDLYFAYYSADVAKQRKMTQAEQLANIAQLINPEPKSDKLLMYQKLCQAWQNEGEPKKALPWCELGTQVVRNGWTHLALAQAQYKLREYEEALITLEWVVEKAPQELKGKAHQQMGETYLAAGRAQEAVHAYQAALTQGVSNKWIQMGLAQALLRSDQLEEACIYYANADQLGYFISAAQLHDFEACNLNASFPKEPP